MQKSYKVNTKELLHQTIISLCKEISSKESSSWKVMSELELINELVFCTLCVSMRFEKAMEVMSDIDVERTLLLLNMSEKQAKNLLLYGINELDVTNSYFKTSFQVLNESSLRKVWNILLAIQSEKIKLKEYLNSCEDEFLFRRDLILKIKGLNSQIVSLFLERINYSSKITYVDRFSVKYFEFDESKNFTSSLKSIDEYELIERSLYELSLKVGHCLQKVSLATRITMKEFIKAKNI